MRIHDVDVPFQRQTEISGHSQPIGPRPHRFDVLSPRIKMVVVVEMMMMS